MFRNICLIGLPYSGKTTIGNQLYKYLHKGFVDTDDIIRSKYNTDLPSIISKYGRSKFLEIEQDVITSLKLNNMVISTGGSVIYQEESMKHLKEELNSEIYHLFLSRKEYMMRTREIERRGVIIHPEQSKIDLYNERLPLYDKYSDKTISACRDINLDLFRGETYYPRDINLHYNEKKLNYYDNYDKDDYFWNPNITAADLNKRVI